MPSSVSWTTFTAGQQGTLDSGAHFTVLHVDPTLQRYIGNVLSVALTILLVVAILGYFGVETTSFAALIAGLGIAIGAAWAGLLANFAAGAFLIVLRPFKVGDYVKAGGVDPFDHLHAKLG